MNETEAQFVLRDWSEERRHVITCPNVYLFHGESDMVCVTAAGLAIEIEIKMTVADFRNELAYLQPRPAAGSDEKWLKHTLMSGREVEPLRFHAGAPSSPEERAKRIPSQYYIAAPAGLLTPTMLPAHAGLIEIRNAERFGAVVVKKAPRLHMEAITVEKWKSLARSMGERFWRERARRRHEKN